MVEFNRQERIVKVKIAYYGPAVGGKTTNLKVLYDRARGGRRGEFVSVNSQQDRTILCDLLPLKSGGFRGFDLRFQLAAVPGQAIYAPARRVVLRGSDGVVFVANSATDRFHENVQAFRELQGHLLAQQLDPATIPMVLQYNKRDLPDVLEAEALDRALNARRLPVFPAVATRGEGVLETFAAIIQATLEDLARRYPASPCPRGRRSRTGRSRRSSRCSGRRGSPAGETDEERRHRRPARGGALQRRGLGPPPAAAVDAGGAGPDGGGGARRGVERGPGRVLRPGLDRARRAARRHARGARPRAVAARRAADRPRARGAEGGGGADRGPRPADPQHPHALGGSREREPAPDHERPAADPGAAPARHRPAGPHALGRAAPARPAGPGGGAARGGRRRCPRWARRSATASRPSRRWPSCRCARPSACWPWRSSTSGRT